MTTIDPWSDTLQRVHSIGLCSVLYIDPHNMRSPELQVLQETGGEKLLEKKGKYGVDLYVCKVITS